MSDPVKTLASWYPFIPELGSVPSDVKNIVDARIIVTIPADRLYENTYLKNTDAICASITSIQNMQATVKVKCTNIWSTAQLLTVPVYDIRTQFPTTLSYILTKAPGILQTEHRLHLDCLVFLQKAPTLTLQQRTQLYTTGTATLTDKVCKDIIYIYSGYNTQVTYSDNCLTINGIAGDGKGKLKLSPYVDAPGEVVLQEQKGARSINGITGSCAISGTNDIIVLITRVTDEVKLDITASIQEE